MQNRMKLLSALSFFGSTALLTLPSFVFAGELNINADDGSTLLRMEAPENNTFDIKVEFNSIDLNKNAHINIKSEKGESRDILVSQDAMTKGVLIPTLPLGVYSLSASSKNTDIRKVSIVNENKDKSAAVDSVNDDSISSYTLGGGAVAAVAAAAAVTVGGGVDALSGGNNGSTNSSREGRLNTTSITNVDPNRPNPSFPISSAPAVVVTAAPVIGNNPSGNSSAVPAPSVAPIIAPAPPIKEPMTPS